MTLITYIILKSTTDCWKIRGHSEKRCRQLGLQPMTTNYWLIWQSFGQLIVWSIKFPKVKKVNFVQQTVQPYWCMAFTSCVLTPQLHDQVILINPFYLSSCQCVGKGRLNVVYLLWNKKFIHTNDVFWVLIYQIYKTLKYSCAQLK